MNHVFSGFHLCTVQNHSHVYQWCEITHSCQRQLPPIISARSYYPSDQKVGTLALQPRPPTLLPMLLDRSTHHTAGHQMKISSSNLNLTHSKLALLFLVNLQAPHLFHGPVYVQCVSLFCCPIPVYATHLL